MYMHIYRYIDLHYTYVPMFIFRCFKIFMVNVYYKKVCVLQNIFPSNTFFKNHLIGRVWGGAGEEKEREREISSTNSLS